MYDLVTVRLADREQPILIAPDTPWLKQAVADGLLIVLDQPQREPGRARAAAAQSRSRAAPVRADPAAARWIDGLVPVPVPAPGAPA